MQARATAIILGVVTLVVGMLVAAILDQQAVQDIAARCMIASNAAPFTANQDVILSDESANCDDTGLLTPSTAARANAVIRNAPRAIATAEVRPLATQVSGATESRAGITSFSGAKPLNDLVPTLVRVVLVMIGVGMIGIGGAGFVGIGPLGRTA